MAILSRIHRAFRHPYLPGNPKPLAALTLAALISASLTGCRSEMGPAGRPPDTDTEKLSYGMGVDIGKSLRQQNLEIDPEYLRMGIRDARADEGLLISEDEINRIMAAHYQKLAKDEQQAVMQEEMSSRDSVAAERYRQRREASLKFLKENGAKDSVITTASGLQYQVIRAGQGVKPSLKDTVEVHYLGTLINGREFERRLGSDPAVFPVAQVLPGWKEALPLMREGSKWKIVVPPELAFGREGSGHMIGPYATLVFELELVKVRRAGKKDA